MILISRRIHVWYIYLHLHKNQPNVGTVNIPYMDPMGMENFLWNRADELSWSNYPKFHQASATCFPGKLSKFWLLAPGAVSKFPGQVWKTNRKKYQFRNTKHIRIQKLAESVVRCAHFLFCTSKKLHACGVRETLILRIFHVKHHIQQLPNVFGL